LGGDSKIDEALALFDEGRTCMSCGDHALAVEKLKRAVALAPTGPSLAALGQSLFVSERHAEAVVHLAAALEMGEARSTLRIMLARAIANTGDRTEALRRLRDVLRDHPDSEEGREAIKSILPERAALAAVANRRRLLDAIRAALPDIRIDVDDSPVRGLELVGRYIASWAATPADRKRLATAFGFLNNLLPGADQDGADLLAAVVFPLIVPWRSAVVAARELLIGRARRAFDDTVALAGPATGDDDPLIGNYLRDEIRVVLPELALPAGSPAEIGQDLGRRFVAAIKAGAADADLKRIGRLLSRMAASDDTEVRDAFNDALAQIVETPAPDVIEIARSGLTGVARTALENLS
jgi:hypothetical protein